MNFIQNDYEISERMSHVFGRQEKLKQNEQKCSRVQQ